MTTKEINDLITEFSGTTFHVHYTASDWLLHKLMIIKDKHEKELNENTN